MQLLKDKNTLFPISKNEIKNNIVNAVQEPHKK